MKSFVFLALVFFVVSFSAFGAKEPAQKAEFFEAAKTYQDKDYTLNDVIEFAIFDMSEVKFINESYDIVLKTTKDGLMKLPKLFYQNLKKEVLAELVPVTLYPSTAPEHTKPLQLSIKIKSLHLKSTEEGPSEQFITMRIFGQLDDKKTGEALIKFYDSGSEAFWGSEDVNRAFDEISGKMMKNLALFLKSKY